MGGGGLSPPVVPVGWQRGYCQSLLARRWTVLEIEGFTVNAD